MSWFTISDLAKSALNEAQKRIDKVLDIQDENGNGSVTTLKNTSTSLGTVNTNSSKTKTDEVTTQPNRPLSAERKVNSNITKKRSKPAKLGASLTKRQPFSENKFNSVRNLSLEPTSLKQEELLIKEPRTQNENIATIDLQETLHENNVDNNQAFESSLMTSSVVENKFEEEKLFTDSGVDFMQETVTEKLTNSHKLISDDPTPILNNINKCESKTPDFNGDCKHINLKTSPAKHLKENNDHEISNHMRDSPCGGSTATSSEIDILDHESVYSDTFTNSKISELDGTYPGTMDNFFTRDFADRIGSEASDFSRITSPLSVNESENVGYKSPVLFTDHFDPNTTQVNVQEQKENLAIEDKVEKETKNVLEILIDDKPEEENANNETVNKLELLEDDLEGANKNNFPIESETDIVETVETNFLSDVQEQSLNSCEIVQQKEPTEIDNKTELKENQQKEHTNNEKEESQEINEKSKPVENPTNINDKEDKIKQEVISSTSVDQLTEEKLAFYDQQLVSLSLSNASLSEENDNLRSEIGNAKLMAAQEINEKTVELENTIDEMNKTIESLQMEKSSLANQLLTTTADLSQRLSSEQVQHMITEKEESIQGLLLEGEQLSKQHLQQNNLIKKLRSKLTDKERAVTDANETITQFETENKELNERLSKVEGQSSENRGTAERLSEAYHVRAAEVDDLRNKLEDAEEKRRAAQSTLDAAYKDLADLHKKQVGMESEKETQIQRAEEIVMARMQQQIEKIEQDNEHQKHMLVLQINELHGTVERTEVLCSRKEDQLRKEIKDLQQRLQESEIRNHDLSNSISDSTRPLLRQMENLQATHSTQAKTWDALEKNLTARLADAHVQTTTAQEKERSANMLMVDLKSKLISSEQQVSNLKDEKQNLTTEVERLKSEVKTVNENFTRLKQDHEHELKIHSEAMSKARKDRLTLENQLDMEKLRSDVDRKKFQAQYEAIQKEKERLAWLSRSESVGSASMFNTDADSTDGSEIFNHADGVDRQLSSTTVSGVYDTIRSSATSGSALLENLQSQLKQRDGEIAQLQGEINTLERTRSSMAEEIVRLTNMNEDLENSVEKGKDLKHQLKEMKARYDAVLTMYGEKEEEAEELKLDLEDVKAMYRNQIDLLLKKN